jgi:hypothetical protein
MHEKDRLKPLLLADALALLRNWQTEKTLVLLKSSEPAPRIQDRPVEIVLVDSSRLVLQSLGSGQIRKTPLKGAEFTYMPGTNGPSGLTITLPDKNVLTLEIPVPVNPE